jgi:site-specific DNA recombinase
MSQIIGYGRVSSREQAENSHALEQQIQRLKDAGATEILRDIESGSSNDRAAFQRLLRLIQSGQCDEVVVTRLDRLTRSLLTLRKVIDLFKESGVNLRALDDCIDFKSAAGKFHLNMLGALAEMEVDRLAERVLHGWNHLRERKVAMNPPFGYIKVDDHHELDHHPFLCLVNSRQELSKATIARDLVDIFLEKKTLRMAIRGMNERFGIQTFAHNNEPGQAQGGRVAQKMFRFSPVGFRNWLTNPVLQGHLSYLRHKGDRAQIHYDAHPDQRLITDEEAQQIAAIISHNQRVKGYGSTALKYPLSGLVFCGECRSSCYSLKGGRGKNTPGYNYYFQCKNWRVRSCSQKKVIQMGVVEAAVIEKLCTRVETITQIAESPPSTVFPPELQALRSELAFYEAAPGNRAAVIITDLKRQIEQFHHQTDQRAAVDEGNRELLLRCFRDRLYWKTLLDDEKQSLYRALVDRVVVKDGQVQDVILKV